LPACTHGAASAAAVPPTTPAVSAPLEVAESSVICEGAAATLSADALDFVSTEELMTTNYSLLLRLEAAIRLLKKKMPVEREEIEKQIDEELEELEMEMEIQAHHDAEEAHEMPEEEEP